MGRESSVLRRKGGRKLLSLGDTCSGASRYIHGLFLSIFLHLNAFGSGGTCPGLYGKSLIIRPPAYLTIRQPTPTQKMPNSHRSAQIKLYIEGPTCTYGFFLRKRLHSGGRCKR